MVWRKKAGDSLSRWNWPTALQRKREREKAWNQLNLELKPFIYHSTLGMCARIFLPRSLALLFTQCDLRKCGFIRCFRCCIAMLCFYNSQRFRFFVFSCATYSKRTFHCSARNRCFSIQNSSNIMSEIKMCVCIYLPYISAMQSHILFCPSRERSVTFF